MKAALQCTVLDCADVLELARFYQSLLGGVVNKPDPRWSLSEGWSTLHLETGAVLAFQRVPEYQPPLWPDPSRPQQFHLDLAVEDLDAGQECVLELGGTLLDPGDGKRVWRVFADPAGHPFCLVGHLWRGRSPAQLSARLQGVDGPSTPSSGVNGPSTPDHQQWSLKFADALK